MGEAPDQQRELGIGFGGCRESLVERQARRGGSGPRGQRRAGATGDKPGEGDQKMTTFHGCISPVKAEILGFGAAEIVIQVDEIVDFFGYRMRQERLRFFAAASSPSAEPSRQYSQALLRSRGTP